jgi:uncharacterized membrane protein
MSSLHEPRISVRGIREYEESHRPTSDLNVGDAERWASTIGGSLLLAQGLRRGSFGGLALALFGGSLIYRGVTGHCQAYQALHIDTSDKHRAAQEEHIHKGRLAKHSTTVNRPAEELYRFWREQTNAPKFMTNIESVVKTGEKTSHWVLVGPLGKKFSWDSEVITEDAGRIFAWKSLPGGDLSNAGSVRFETLPGDRGTAVTLEVNFEPPAGALGVIAARLFGEDPDAMTREHLRRFKQLMEAGEIATIEGQTSGRLASQPGATPGRLA